ncbi:MAG: hypothetical protein GEV03_16080 [Streptosporangiales bacterium]|nr:hypothetical protein [Streptosporangiales bacterium]
MSTSAPRAPDTGTPDEDGPGRRSRLTDNRVWIAAVATFMVPNLLIELLGGVVSESAVGGLLRGPLLIVAYLVAPLLLLVWLVGQAARLWRELLGPWLERIGLINPPKPPGEDPTGSPTRRLAEQATRWGVGLAGDAAAEAESWFRAEEPSLRQLLDDRAYDGNPLPGQAVEELAVIAGSLDTWYVRQRELDDLIRVNDSLRRIASRAARPDLEELTALRMATAHRLRGDLGAARAELEDAKEIAERVPRHPCAAALEARRYHEWALIHLAEAERRTDDHQAAADELENAARALEDGWARLPRADISGEITTLVNLAVVALHLEHLEHLEPKARSRGPEAIERPRGEPYRRRPRVLSDHLGLAEALARAERDLAGLAHAIELRGVAAWLDEQHRLAAERWRDAHDRYAELGLAGGQARCLQHLGSAILAVPEVAGLLRDNRWVVPGELAATSEALSLLERSRELRAKLPHVDTELVDHYLRVAEGRVSGRLPADGPRRTDPLRRRLGRLTARARRWWKDFP